MGYKANFPMLEDSDIKCLDYALDSQNLRILQESQMGYKSDFPMLKDNKIVYLDTASTAQKPQIVIDKISQYYTNYCSNVHRSNYNLSNDATLEYEKARKKIAHFFNIENSDEVLFTSGTTESINVVASCFVKEQIQTVIISELEHHANIVPWQLAGKTLGNGLKLTILKDDLNIDIQKYEELVKANPGSLVSITHISNVIGIVNPIKELTKIAHKYNCLVLVDGAQSVPHMKVDIKDLDVDFYAASAHKMFGPTGIGFLYGRKSLIEKFQTYRGGGGMIDDVSFEKTTFLTIPHGFEAGTPNIAGVIGFGSAIDYITSIGYDTIKEIEQELFDYAMGQLSEIQEIELYTTAKNLGSIISFNVKGVHHSDIGTLMSKQKILLRTGHHCAMPLMKKLGIAGTVRISLSFYNTKEDIDRAIKALKKTIKIVKR